MALHAVALANGILICLSAILAIGFFLVSYKPFIEYDPSKSAGPAGLTASPGVLIEDFLWRSGRLPEPGTAVVARRPLAWHESADPNRLVTDISVTRVRLTARQGLLMSIFNDDPTLAADVYATVTTSDDKQNQLTFRLWDWGRITPWSVRQQGDGWKPGWVVWGSP